MAIKSCSYIGAMKYSKKRNVKGGTKVITKVPGLNWTPSLAARKKRSDKAMDKLAEEKLNLELAEKLLNQ